MLVVEGQNRLTGLGIRYGTWLLEAGCSPKYDYMGVLRPGEGGIAEHIPQQNLSPQDIYEKIKKLSAK